MADVLMKRGLGLSGDLEARSYFDIQPLSLDFKSCMYRLCIKAAG